MFSQHILGDIRENPTWFFREEFLQEVNAPNSAPNAPNNLRNTGRKTRLVVEYFLVSRDGSDHDSDAGTSEHHGKAARVCFDIAPGQNGGSINP